MVGAVASANAAGAAGHLGYAGLAARLGDLSTALTNLSQNPTSAIYGSQVLADVDSVLVQMGSDPFLLPDAPALAAARAVLAGAGNASDIQAAVIRLGDALTALATTLADEAANGFTFSLASNSLVAPANAAAYFGLLLKNNGSLAAVYDLGVSGLPANVTAVFTRNGNPIRSVTLQPGQTIAAGFDDVILELTETGGSLFSTGFTVTLTAEGRPEITRSAQGVLTVRPASLAVIRVVADPASADPATPVDVTATFATAVNSRAAAQ